VARQNESNQNAVTTPITVMLSAPLANADGGEQANAEQAVRSAYEQNRTGVLLRDLLRLNRSPGVSSCQIPLAKGRVPSREWCGICGPPVGCAGCLSLETGR
jgi:hypothetical protein